jgi:hypothetical protein
LSQPVPGEKEAKKLLPQEITIRLRENREWTISRIELTTPENIESYLQAQLDKGLSEELGQVVRNTRSAQCRPKRVEVYIGDAPKPRDGWKKIADIDWPQDQLAIRHDFEPVTAQYIKLSIVENWGGPCVALGNVRVFDSSSSADGAEAGFASELAASGDAPNIGWQFLAYLILTSAEVMVSIVCLEFAYTQAPASIKSFIMGVYLLGVSLGNALTALVNWIIQNEDGSSKLDGASYYWFFTAAMFFIACLYVVWSQFYRGQTYIQGDDALSH